MKKETPTNREEQLLNLPISALLVPQSSSGQEAYFQAIIYYAKLGYLKVIKYLFEHLFKESDVIFPTVPNKIREALGQALDEGHYDVANFFCSYFGLTYEDRLDQQDQGNQSPKEEQTSETEAPTTESPTTESPSDSPKEEQTSETEKEPTKTGEDSSSHLSSGDPEADFYRAMICHAEKGYVNTLKCHCHRYRLTKERAQGRDRIALQKALEGGHHLVADFLCSYFGLTYSYQSARANPKIKERGLTPGELKKTLAQEQKESARLEKALFEEKEKSDRLEKLSNQLEVLLDKTNKQQKRWKIMLDKVERQLDLTKSDLNQSHGEITQLKEELAKTKEELAKTKEELAQAQEELAKTKEKNIQLEEKSEKDQPQSQLVYQEIKSSLLQGAITTNNPNLVDLVCQELQITKSEVLEIPGILSLANKPDHWKTLDYLLTTYKF